MRDRNIQHDYCPPPFAKAGDIKTDTALIFRMHDTYDKPFQLAPCRDLYLDL